MVLEESQFSATSESSSSNSKITPSVCPAITSGATIHFVELCLEFWSTALRPLGNWYSGTGDPSGDFFVSARRTAILSGNPESNKIDEFDRIFEKSAEFWQIFENFCSKFRKNWFCIFAGLCEYWPYFIRYSAAFFDNFEEEISIPSIPMQARRTEIPSWRQAFPRGVIWLFWSMQPKVFKSSAALFHAFSCGESNHAIFVAS